MNEPRPRSAKRTTPSNAREHERLRIGICGENDVTLLRANLLAMLVLFAWVAHHDSASAEMTQTCEPDFLTLDPRGE